MSALNPNKPLRRQELASLIETTGSNFAVLEPAILKNEIAIAGDFRMLKLRSGLILHATDTVDVCDLMTQVEHEPTLIALLFLAGAVNMSLGGREYHLGPDWRGVQERSAPEGLLLSMTEPDLFTRHARRGNHVRKVTVSMTPDWLQDGMGDISPLKALKGFNARHLAEARWQLNARMIELVESILRPSPLNPALHNLYLEAQAMELMAGSLQAASAGATIVSEQRQREAGMAGRTRLRLQRVRDYLDAHAGVELSLDVIARDVGMSISVLQRLFHAAFGTSVFDYVRRDRMQRARTALARDQVSVTEAADIAGYTSPANFATAFKRRFGVSPKEARKAGL